MPPVVTFEDCQGNVIISDPDTTALNGLDEDNNASDWLCSGKEEEEVEEGELPKDLPPEDEPPRGNAQAKGDKISTRGDKPTNVDCEGDDEEWELHNKHESRKDTELMSPMRSGQWRNGNKATKICHLRLQRTISVLT